MTAWDDVLVDGVDTIDANRWNALITALSGKSVAAHAHDEFHIMPNSDYWYVYKVDSTYYAKNMGTGAVDYSGSNFSTVMTSTIGAIPNAGFIKLGTGTFVVPDAITTGNKGIIIEGSGWGRSTSPYVSPGTLIESDTTGAFPLITFGQHGDAVIGAGIRNCAFYKDPSNTACLAAVELYNTINCFVDHCHFYNFNNTAKTMKSISIRGATDETVGGWNNRVTFNHLYYTSIGILLGANANYCHIEGNYLEGMGNMEAYGLKCDGTGATMASPVNCFIIGNTIWNFNGTGAKGFLVTAGSNNSGLHSVFGNNFHDCTVDIQVDSGTGIGGCSFIGNKTPNGMTDNGNVTSYYAGA